MRAPAGGVVGGLVARPCSALRRACGVWRVARWLHTAAVEPAAWFLFLASPTRRHLARGQCATPAAVNVTCVPPSRRPASSASQKAAS